jgi:FAD synthetase
MVRVMATGVFDLIHLGHLHYLQEAKKLGDELVVVVARDSTVKRVKHEPITPEAIRRDLVAALKPVDEAILGVEGDIFETVRRVRPDVIALGYDQPFKEQWVEEECRRRGMPVKVVRVGRLDGNLNGTRRIVRRILEQWGAAPPGEEEGDGESEG